MENTIPKWKQSGFALVATLSIVSLLVLVTLAMLSLSSSVTRSNSQEFHLNIAKANARLALVNALGELQRYAGQDQRITATSDFVADARNRHWTGVWSTRNPNSKPVWLVSGNEGKNPEDLDLHDNFAEGYIQPFTDIADQFTLYRGEDASTNVTIPLVRVTSGDNTWGKYGWWVADEGVKARVNVTPNAKPNNQLAQTQWSRLPQEANISLLPELVDFDSNSDATSGHKKRILSLKTLELASNNRTIAKKYFHDLTSGGIGIPTDVKNGSLKSDLSLLFDTTQRNTNIATDLMGAKPSYIRTGFGAITYAFPNANITQPEKFFLAPQLTKEGRYAVGPNWGTLYNYAQLYKSVSEGNCPVILPYPIYYSDMRYQGWSPYTNDNRGRWKNDWQHHNSPLAPVLSSLQFGVRLSAEEITPAAAGVEAQYAVYLHFKPVVALWNPHNVKLKNAYYNFDMALYPYVKMGYKRPEQPEKTKEVWMREHWMARGDETDLDKWFLMRTPAIDLEPGEIRYFSVTEQTNIETVNRLTPTWNEEGAFKFRINLEGGLLPEGSEIWYESLFIEDTQHPGTLTRFGNRYSDVHSASWFALKAHYFDSDGPNIQRISDLWVNPNSTQQSRVPFTVPAQVVAPTPNKLKIEDIDDVPMHIGTWRWNIRTSTGAPDGQKIRGLVDTNVRYNSASPLWDGSKISDDDNYNGWYFISPFVGGSFGPDNKGLGKVAQGQNEVPSFPEALLQGDRYQGFGGWSNTSMGQTHVPVLDVPRGSLVSLGQFQHAHLTRYSYEPTHAFGNSYANPRIPLDQIQVDDYAGIENFTMLDISYVLNEALWDSYFFSTVGRNYKGYRFGDASFSIDAKMPLKEIANGQAHLPNPRHIFHTNRADNETFDSIIANAGGDLARSTSSRIGIIGAFNINSTSKNAWKVLLGSLQNYDLPEIDIEGKFDSWETPQGIHFSKFGHNLQTTGWDPVKGALDKNFWQGFRSLSAEEVDALAEKIVEEVKYRGPFRSMAEFVNRNPYDERPESQRKGALQAALDQTVNNQDALKDVGGMVDTIKGDHFSQNTYDGESEAAGFAGYLNQSDILQSIAPLMQARSDYFTIRTVGISLDSNENVMATAICEAKIQRMAPFMDNRDPAYTKLEDLEYEVNRRFGRRFKMLSFQWLSDKEI